MKEKTKKRTKYAACITGGVVLATVAGTAAYVFGHKPDVVNKPCFRSCHRIDKLPKKTFGKAWKANWQTVKQFFFHGEVCNSYKVGDKYYTGHSKNAFCRSINPFKNIQSMVNPMFYEGVGKKVRAMHLVGNISDMEVGMMFNRNKKEADAFDGYGWTLFDLIQEEKRTHNPLLRKKLQFLIEDHKQKSRCSATQNAVSVNKLMFYHDSALGCGIRPIRNYLYKLGKRGDEEATILAMLIDIEYANLMAKKRTDKKKVIYERKHILMAQVSDLLYDNGWVCGISPQTGKNAGWIVYVYLPDGSQLSWHSNEYTMLYCYGDIDCEWDGRTCSTLEKLLAYAHAKYNIGEVLVLYENSLVSQI